ncbi:MAG TPA: DUF4282 domain-containing protein [Propionibacteriaceae bacterium]|nr:DUF4282 domain-containing protein [Propionibacteriaceae bacterium]
MTTLPPGMYPPPHTPHGTQSPPIYGQQLLPGWEQRTRSGSGGGLGDMFDFSFDTYVTPRLVRIIYAIAVVLIGVGYLGYAILMLVLLPPLGLGILLLGWIPALLCLLSVRVGLEVTLATVRTAVDARALRTQYVGSPVE